MRKDLLASSLKKVADQRAGISPEPPEPIRMIPSVKAVQRGLEYLSGIEAQDINPDDIAESLFKSRITLEEGIDSLVESIRTSGQKIPILVRRLTDSDKKYAVVYGRRRMEACRRLGLTVRANVLNLGLRDSIVIQGLENATRLDPSFIEQAHYARMLEKNDFKRHEIADILAVNELTLSSMMNIISYVPDEVIKAIGPAHGSHHRSWKELRKWFEQNDSDDVNTVLSLIDGTLPGSDRLEVLIKALKGKAGSEKRLIGSDNISVKRSRRKISIQIRNADDEGFLKYIDDNLDALYESFKSSADNEN